MVKKILIIIVLLGLIAGLGFYLLFPTSEKDKIKSKLDSLADSASKTSEDGGAALALKSQIIASLFDKKCNFDTKVSSLAGTYTPEEIASKSVWAKKQFSKVILSFYDLNIEYSEDTPDQAKMVFTARLNGTLKSGKQLDEYRNMEAELKKVKGKWLFSSFSLVEVFEK